MYKKNPGTSIKLKTFKDGDDHVFKFLYICPGALKRGFLDGCRRVISLDACFLKGPWNGQVFVAVGKDANNQMYPIAWGVTQSETREGLGMVHFIHASKFGDGRWYRLDFDFRSA